jgi:hypothetical protein
MAALCYPRYSVARVVHAVSHLTRNRVLFEVCEGPEISLYQSLATI